MKLHKIDPEEFPSEETEDITAQIRPLPENVVPSERFLKQMRLRLLQMEPDRKNQSFRAA
jgi:hypothetical protein